MEEWRAVVGWPEYDVSSLGRVRSYRANGRGGRRAVARLLKGTVYKGYVRFGFADGERVIQMMAHALVLEAFVGLRPDGLQACHANGVKTDNRPENLRWDTAKSNSRDRVAHGTQTRGDSHPIRQMPWLIRGEKNGNSKFTEEGVREARSLGFSAAQVMARWGVSKTSAHFMLNGRTWKHVK